MSLAITNPSTFPTLATVTNLMRLHLNDWQKGATGTPGEGQISTNNPLISPQVPIALGSAIRDLYRKLRLVGDPVLIRDNVQAQLSPVNPNVNPPNPQVQVALTPNGFYDGWEYNPTALLPSDFLKPIMVSETQTGSGQPFQPMREVQGGLPSRNQGNYLGEWEYRNGFLWFVGSTNPITIAMRYYSRQVVPIGPDVNYQTTSIPVLDCEEYLGWQTAYLISFALNGVLPNAPSTQALKGEADAAMEDLISAVIRERQGIDYQRQPYEVNGGQGGWGQYGTF